MIKQSPFSFLLGIGLGAIVLALLEVVLEVHFPGTDVFLFKEAGVNLATKGRFTAANLPHSPFGQERPFAYYPPLYPFAFGVWSWLVGVGLKQSILFDALLRILRTALMLVLTLPALPQDFFSKKERWFRWGVGTLFCLLTVASTDRDRPDELAIIFGLLVLITLNSKISNRPKVLLAGLLLACVGATSPACGIFFALLAGVWTLTSTKKIQFSLALFTTALVCGVFLLMPVVLEDGSSGIRFSKQAGISTFPYLRFLNWHSPWKKMGESFLHFWNIFRATSPQFLWLATLLSVCFFVRNISSGKTPAHSPFFFWGTVSICFGVAVPLVWTLQPYYLWFPCLVLIVWFFQSLATEKTFRKWAALTLLYGFLAPFWIWEAKCFVNALQMPSSEKRDQIQKTVLENLEPGASLAITHDQFFTFRRDRPLANYDYWGWNSKVFDYLYVTELADSQHLEHRGRRILASQSDNCFSLVRDFSTKTPLKILGFQTKHFVRGHGGSLFKNNCKSTSHSS